ncbi:hypothetical protein [Gemmatimonas sp.]|uniref:hypothetical protein n=1 Tax=Gemmatimonas sp. TaxID=1962908 RepID=UPI00286AE9C4|nr:hypothetical protein [Gemmatimonas sp.]
MRQACIRVIALSTFALTVVGTSAQAQGASQGKAKKSVNAAGQKIPPGLAKKPGGMPPGQYKKRYGTREGATVLGDIFGRNGYPVRRITPYGESQYVYYRMPDGSERRAIVSPGADQLRFSNVPATLLQQVIAQLYR